jgi:ABC-type transport system involved in Fe-S cluster assembly fused permease/ATPase subunit
LGLLAGNSIVFGIRGWILTFLNRTSAGKSLIMTGNVLSFCDKRGPYFQSSALYRLVELSSGSVTIDGVDVSKISLTDLRKALAIISQDPVCGFLPSIYHSLFVNVLMICPLASM